jgi:uncharacterized RDD family membrane protein YckC
MPSPIDLNAAKRSLDAKTSLQLIDILSFSQDDYDPTIIPLVENILLERGVSKMDIAASENSYSNLKNKIDNQQVSNRPAAFWPRVTNYFIDHFICYALVYSLQSYEQFTVKDQGLYYGAVFGIYVAYYTLTIWLFKGTAGMLIFGLKVVYTKDKKQADFFAGLTRGVFMIISFLTLQIGHLIMLGDKNKRTLVDRATGTSVVYK